MRHRNRGMLETPHKLWTHNNSWEDCRIKKIYMRFMSNGKSAHWNAFLFYWVVWHRSNSVIKSKSLLFEARIPPKPINALYLEWLGINVWCVHDGLVSNTKCSICLHLSSRQWSMTDQIGQSRSVDMVYTDGHSSVSSSAAAHNSGLRFDRAWLRLTLITCTWMNGMEWHRPVLNNFIVWFSFFCCSFSSYHYVPLWLAWCSDKFQSSVPLLFSHRDNAGWRLCTNENHTVCFLGGWAPLGLWIFCGFVISSFTSWYNQPRLSTAESILRFPPKLFDPALLKVAAGLHCMLLGHWFVCDDDGCVILIK